MKYYVLAEVREDHKSLLDTETIYNDYVSKRSMNELVTACCQNGFDCKFLGGMAALKAIIENHQDINDCIFINYNYGYPAQFKRGQSPILLEMINAKYSGSDPLTSLIVNDKAFSKKVIKEKVNVPKSLLLFSKKDINKISSRILRFPVIVKPNSEGSSLGIDEKSYCNNENSAVNKAVDLLKSFSPILVEEYIPGFEVTVWIIGNKGNYKLIQPLVISTDNKFYFENRIFTVNDKANHTRNYSLPNSVLPNYVIEKIIDNSKIVFEELGMRDYGRIDFRVFDNRIYFIEANALPIFSQTSEIGEITKLCKISYNNICRKMIETINERLMPKTD